MKEFDINIHKNAFFQISLSFVELCLGFHNKIFKLFHPLSMELLKGLVRYEAVFPTQVIHRLCVSQNMPPYAFKILLEWFPNEGPREMHPAKAQK